MGCFDCLNLYTGLVDLQQFLICETVPTFQVLFFGIKKYFSILQKQFLAFECFLSQALLERSSTCTLELLPLSFLILKTYLPGDIQIHSHVNYFILKFTLKFEFIFILFRIRFHIHVLCSHFHPHIQTYIQTQIDISSYGCSRDPR